MTTKYRIMEEARADGSFYYYPQYKGWFFWNYFRCGYEGCDVRTFSDFDYAKDFIDSEREREAARTVTGKSFTEY